MKLIWTEKERVERFEKTRDLPPLVREPPLELVTVEPESEIRVGERPKATGAVTGYTVYFPVGCGGLVQVNVTLNETLLMGPLVGDDVYHHLLDMTKVTPEDWVGAVLKNCDKMAHVIGIRIDVNEIEE